MPEPGNPQALNRYAYVNNNPLKYTDPSGYWLETAWDIANIAWGIYEVRRDPGNVWNWAALAVDVGATVLPFVPAGAGLVVRGGKVAKAAVEAASHANQVEDAARVMAETASHADEAAEALRAGKEATQEVVEQVVKAPELPRRFSRYMSKSEREIVQETGLLRGGRPGDTYFTTNKFRTIKSAEEKLALPRPPEMRLDFEIINQPRIYGPRKVAPAFGKPGGGVEYWSPDPVRVRIIRWRDLR